MLSHIKTSANGYKTMANNISIYMGIIISSTGRRPASLCHGPSCVRPCVRACFNIFLNIFSETTNRSLMKFHRNVPAMVLFRIFGKNLIPSKTGCHGNKTYFLRSLKIFWSETIRLTATRFGM